MQRAGRQRRRGAAVGRQQAEHLEQDRRAGFAPDMAGTRRAVGAAHPHADGVVVGETHRPGIAEAVGGAGLEADGALASAAPAPSPSLRAAPRRPGYRADTRPRPARTGDGCGASGASAMKRKRLRLAAFGDAGIEHGDVGQRDAEAAQRHRQAGRVMRSGKARCAPAFCSVRVKAKRPDAIQHHHRRHVQRHAAAHRAPSPRPGSAPSKSRGA